MKTACKTIKGVLFLAAGGVILAPTLGVTAISPMLATQIVGGCIALVGLLILSHAFGLCKPCCGSSHDEKKGCC